MVDNPSSAHDSFIQWCNSVGLDANNSGIAYMAFNAGYRASKSTLNEQVLLGDTNKNQDK